MLVGSGAASAACAEMLRNEGYDGPVTMIGDEAPVDRPNVSKDFLAGTAPDEWMPLRPLDFYRDSKIDFVSGLVRAIDPAAKKVSTGDRELAYGALLYAPGAEPVRLPIEGAQLPHVHTIRTLADAQAIIAKLGGVRRVVAIGASFIALEAAASLRARGLEVSVVAPERVPLERVLGAEVGGFVQKLHESNGVVFRLGRKPVAIDGTHVTLDDGTRLDAELVIMGTGVRPRLDLAKSAGLAIDGGVVVDERLRASADGVYAAGDVARFPYRGARARIEHWVHAERQGQHAARAVLGSEEPFRDVPFFWSVHYDVTIRYTGHSEKPDAITIDGSLDARDATISYSESGKLMAVATIGRDRAALEAQLRLGH